MTAPARLPTRPRRGAEAEDGEPLADGARHAPQATGHRPSAEAGALARPDFDLPRRLEADRPPEARGLARDGVRLMVSTRGEERIEHSRFRELPGFLRPGDLLVVNTSATIRASVPAHRIDGGDPVDVRFSTPASQLEGGEWWVVELRSPGGARPFSGGARPGEEIALPAGARIELAAPYLGSRLWIARFAADDDLHAYLACHGTPVRYGYVADDPGLDAYQTVFALDPGSAEMPSAARPFTPELVTALVARGVGIAPIVLHAGVSSPERGESPYPEPYAVPAWTATAVNSTREGGGRVIAVGTTVVRALETVAGPGWRVSAGRGWTDLVVTPARGLRAVDGLLTGLHEPTSPHVDLLAAIASRSLVERSYAEAVRRQYLWHEFGDSHLILPPSDDRRRTR